MVLGNRKLLRKTGNSTIFKLPVFSKVLQQCTHCIGVLKFNCFTSTVYLSVQPLKCSLYYN